MLNVWKEGGANRGVLGAEVARWPGIVCDTITEPVGLRELTADEKKARPFSSLRYSRDPSCGGIFTNSLSLSPIRCSHNPLIPILIVVTTLVGMVRPTRGRRSTPLLVAVVRSLHLPQD